MQSSFWLTRSSCFMQINNKHFFSKCEWLWIVSVFIFIENEKGKMRKAQTPHAAVQPSSTFFVLVCLVFSTNRLVPWNTVNGQRYQKHDWIVSRAVWRYVGLRLYMTSFMTIWKRVPSETLRLWMRSLKTVLLWGHLAEICNSHNNKSHFLNPNKNTYVSMYDLCRVGWKLSEEEEFGQTWRTDSEN